MAMSKNGVGIIFHSGSYDRIYHGLSIASTAGALGREVRLFFTYWALEYLRKRETPLFELNKEAENHKEIIKRNIEKGHMHKISELIAQSKSMGSKFYACTNSMGLLNISRNELIKDVDKSMGMTTFMAETLDYQILFI
jgi:peroxiredoxin family protein